MINNFYILSISVCTQIKDDLGNYLSFQIELYIFRNIFILDTLTADDSTAALCSFLFCLLWRKSVFLLIDQKFKFNQLIWDQNCRLRIIVSSNLNKLHFGSLNNIFNQEEFICNKHTIQYLVELKTLLRFNYLGRNIVFVLLPNQYLC